MRDRGRRALAGAALTAVLLSGCSAQGSSSGSDAARPADAAAPAQPAPPKAAATGAAGAGAADGKAGTPAADATAGRAIAYTGRMVLESTDPERAADGARQLAVAGGGFVGGESQSGGAQSYTAQLVLRVPSAGYQKTLDALAGLGTVVSRNSQADDLTQQVVDVESRVKTQQASVDRVRALLADAKSLGDVVSLEGELTRREADLESLKRQQQELAAQTSLSTITFDVHRPARTAEAPKPVHRGFWASVGHGFAGGWHVLWAVLRGLAIALAALAPFLVVLAPVAWLVRRWLRRRPARPAPAQASAGIWAAPGPYPGVPAQGPAPYAAPARAQQAPGPDPAPTRTPAKDPEEDPEDAAQ
ncbi:DUF4349 domain-containing protein [Kitasatospora sp. NPDC059571]|uniref:DUF4349 domain-containing protein n=1 Tax=Kitasatospora sp. NPDC059571 TaxID=3346871 RepID=UPI00368E44AA